jgi:hypothetical protein
MSDPDPKKVAEAKLRAAIASLEADATRTDLQPTFRKSARELAEKMKQSLYFLNKGSNTKWKKR